MRNIGRKISVILLFFFSLYAHADDGVLNYDTRKAWTTRNEFYVYMGNYYGDSLENSWHAGAEYMFHISKHFGLGADFAYSKADYKENVYYNQPGFFTNDNVYIIDATGMISFPAAYRVGKNTIESDLFVLLGAGTININSSYEPHGFIGGGMKIFMLKPWLALRVEIRDTFHSTNKPVGSNEFDQDLLFQAGFSFQIPPRIKRKTVLPSNAADKWPNGDGLIAIYDYHLNEAVEVQYRKDGRYLPRALKEIGHVFRSRGDDKEYPIDIRLVGLLDHIQDHFGADTIEIISGYRSPTLNKALKDAGEDVAEESLHLQGRAADIHIDEVTEEAVADYVRSLGIGGVGYYPANDFVHVDIGEVRNWDLPDKPGRELIGLREGIEWQVMTDRNIYLPSESIKYTITSITHEIQTVSGCPILEKFRRGEWMILQELPCPKKRRLGHGASVTYTWLPGSNDPFGKFRITLPAQESHLKTLSNEFYRKRM